VGDNRCLSPTSSHSLGWRSPTSVQEYEGHAQIQCGADCWASSISGTTPSHDDGEHDRVAAPPHSPRPLGRGQGPLAGVRRLVEFHPRGAAERGERSASPPSPPGASRNEHAIAEFLA